MSFANLRVHFIWSTKNRKKLIVEEMQSELYSYFGGILRKRKQVLLAAGGVEDHVHLLVGMHATQSVADCVRDLKSNSSSWIRTKYPKLGGFAWQAKYGAFSISESSVPDVRAYIAKQKEHHKKVSYEEEFSGFLRKHGVEFDPRFVLD